jgi:hypothetical protein
MPNGVHDCAGASCVKEAPALHVYHPDEILFDKRFADILKLTNDGTMWMIDSSQFDLVVQDPLPRIAKTTDAHIC